jgi:flavin-dependent dehydrogenase
VQSDVVVVGGGPAGLCAAIALRLAGYSVTVLDAAVPPIDKACGEGLLPDTIEALAQLGITIKPDQAFRLRGIRFLHGYRQATAEFPGSAGLGMRRITLHRVLTAKADELGVDLKWGVKDVRLRGRTIAAGNVLLKPKLIVGADGHHSVMRRKAGLDRAVYIQRRYGFRRRFRLAPATSCVEIYWHKIGQMYVTPVSADEVGVVLLTTNPRLRINDALPLFPSLAARLASAVSTSAERGSVTASRRLESVQQGNIALVGDASGSVDAITGEGIGLAARQALALARAFHSGQLGRYQAEHARIQRRPAVMSRLLLALARHATVQGPAIAALSKFPWAFEKLLAFHAGGCAPVQLNAAHGHADNVLDFQRFFDDERFTIFDAD